MRIIYALLFLSVLLLGCVTITNNISEEQLSEELFNENENTPIEPLAGALNESKEKVNVEFRVGGCFEDENPEKTAKSRALSNEEEKFGLETIVSDGTLGIKHSFNHACCLNVENIYEIKDLTITLTEKISGDPCRCICSSTIYTTINNLDSGNYTLNVIQNGKSVEKPGEVLESVKVEVI